MKPLKIDSCCVHAFPLAVPAFSTEAIPRYKYLCHWNKTPVREVLINRLEEIKDGPQHHDEKKKACACKEVKSIEKELKQIDEVAFTFSVGGIIIILLLLILLL